MENPVTTSENFLKNYKILEETVQKLRTSQVNDVDQLLGYVEKASEAYKNCKSRIEAVRRLIEVHKKTSEED